MDHFFQIHIVGPADNDMLEGYLALSYVAGVTKTIKLGTMVTALGRPYTDIEKTSLNHMMIARDGRQGSTSPQQAIDFFGELAALGFDTGIVSLRNVSEPDAFEVWAQEIVPAVAKIAVAGR